MSNKFDDLFNEFFEEGSNSNQHSNKKASGFDKISKILSNLANADNENIDEMGILKNIDETLGEPDFIDYYEEDGFYYKKEIWHTKLGKVVKKVMSDVPFLKEETNFEKEIKSKTVKTKKPTKSLDILLEEAVANEDYELAATLRDEIKRRDELN